MLLKRTDIEKKLSNFRNKTISPEALLDQVHAILDADALHEEAIEHTLTQGKSSVENRFDLEFLETDRIYHIEQIKKICIDYRLRFLDSSYFKGAYPQQAVNRIKAIEKQHRITLKGFKIIAPSKLFKLENADDPLLFAPIGNGYYYLIHKWGNDLHPLRKWLMLPFKNLLNLVLLVAFISWLFTELMPMSLFSKEENTAYFWVLYLFIFKMVAGVVLFYGFARGKNFNHAIWNSKYFNA